MKNYIFFNVGFAFLLTLSITAQVQGDCASLLEVEDYKAYSFCKGVRAYVEKGGCWSVLSDEISYTACKGMKTFIKEGGCASLLDDEDSYGVCDGIRAYLENDGSCASVIGGDGYGTCNGIRAFIDKNSGCASVIDEDGYDVCSGIRAYPNAIKKLRATIGGKDKQVGINDRSRSPKAVKYHLVNHVPRPQKSTLCNL